MRKFALSMVRILCEIFKDFYFQRLLKVYGDSTLTFEKCKEF
ncbi:hypothetical protein [Helicobacter labetoulli]|nr:hypothetical protein [Helicobacter labetoulli]